MNKYLKYAAIILTVGILLGIFTSFGQTYIPAPFTQLANSYSMWLLFSFVVGILLKKCKLVSVGVAGIAVQYLAILFYYVASSIRFDMSYSVASLISLNLVWIVGGTLTGPLAALAGKMTIRKTKYAFGAVAFMAGLIFSEALHQFLTLGYVGEGIVFSVAGLLFLGVTYATYKYPLVKTGLATLLFAVLMFFAYKYVLGSYFA